MNLRELQIELNRVNTDIRKYTLSNTLLPGDQNLAKMDAYKAQLVREISELQNPIRSKTKKENESVNLIMRKTEIMRTPQEKYFLSQMINLK